MKRMLEPDSDMIFVFGSNLKGIHGSGAALHAYAYYNAIIGRGSGAQGRSYALPTCSEPGVPLPLKEIELHVSQFKTYAAMVHHQSFFVTRVGCGHAGYKDEQIALMFEGSPDNVWLPAAFVRVLSKSR